MRVSFIRFQTAYHGHAQTALPFAMNSEFSRVLSTEMVSEAGHPQSMFIGNVKIIIATIIILIIIEGVCGIRP